MAAETWGVRCVHETTMTLLSLLNSVISVLIGAVLGYFATVRLHKKERVDLQKGAGRALLAEMFTNADRALSLSGTNQPVGFSDTVWFSQSPVISRLLCWKDLAKVVEAYDAGSRLSSDSLSRDSDLLKGLQKNEPIAHRVCVGIAEAFLEAIELLRGQKGLLNADELSDVDARLRRLRDQAKSTRELFDNKGPDG